MHNVAKILLIAGVALLVLSALFFLAAKLNLPLGRLPGDIRIERENFKFYFPLTTCLLISVIVTLIMWLFRRH